MDPFTLALATFGIQKLRGKSTKKALQSAALIGGGSYALGQVAPQLGIGQGSPLSSIGLGKAPATYGDQGLKSITRSELYGKQFMDPERVATVARSSPLSEAVVGEGSKTAKEGITSNLLKKIKDNKAESAIIASSILPLLAEEEPVDEPMITQEDYDEAYAEEADKLSGAFVPAKNARPTLKDTINDNMFYANQGGLATALPKFNKGGVNYLPSKTDHNENDYNNYVRAEGYVEDGSGNGNKDEDTMLAQLADGEFVSRADAVLGAGILSGADPKSFKNMRKAGADFFYDQQKKFKRIYDIVNASRKDN